MELPHGENGDRRSVREQAEVADVAFLAGCLQTFEGPRNLDLLQGRTHPEEVEVDLFATEGAQRLEEVRLNEVGGLSRSIRMRDLLAPDPHERRNRRVPAQGAAPERGLNRKVERQARCDRGIDQLGCRISRVRNQQA